MASQARLAAHSALPEFTFAPCATASGALLGERNIPHNGNYRDLFAAHPEPAQKCF